VHVAVTDHPTAAWTSQQLCEAFPWDQAPRHLLRDRDHAFDGWAETMKTMGIDELLTATRSPWQNPFVERVIGSLRRECLNHVIVWSERSLRRHLGQYLSTFVRNHARETLACDFFVAVMATFRLVYVFVVLEIGTRRILHWNVTEHPTAAWTAQQFRSVLSGDEPYRFVLHDRDAVFAAAVDDALRSIHLRVLKTPARVPQAKAFCERLIGTARRECLDYLIPLHERHLRKILAEWVPHYNRGRPHASLGPGIPEPSGVTVSRAVDHHLPHGHGSWRNPFSPVSITSTGSSRSRRDSLRSSLRAEYLRSTG
jgi:transposase InsO family protein